jgi:hypothetical protein
MRPDGHAGIPSHPERVAHDGGITSVVSARHVGRRDALHQVRVVAERPPAEGFAEIGVEIDIAHGLSRIGDER